MKIVKNVMLFEASASDFKASRLMETYRIELF